jgi:hypothetical protein
MDRETLHGVIVGDAIQLDRPSHFPDGTAVEVVVSPAASVPTVALADLYGAWSEEGEELDAYLEWCRQQRKIERRPQDT